MAQVKVLCCFLIVALMLSAGLNEVASEDGTAKCCTEHYELGSCIPGKDDDPTTPGKCWAFCISGCEKGGFCKKTGGGSARSKHALPVLSGTPVPQESIRVCLPSTPRASPARLPD
ncbi:hypothetical protein JCGZ_14841 [Jatropha curcas]|uniref:Knottin scorpion toxin-like domain-containing protein n=1 Tax=Jatropha curcas TaxID=180498 RepID=A0A067K5W5_JATCU|nr:hypothetical protein JCGZ_14841 [Jatropha curcas]